MRKFVISLAAAGAALVVASPAAAQYYPQQQYGYGQQAYGYNGGYNGGYGYNGFNNGYGQVRALQARIDAVQNRIRYAGVRGESAERLRKEARNIEKRLRASRYGGLNPYEVNDISQRIARLESRVNYAMARGNGRYGYNGYNGYGGYNAYNNGGNYRERGDHDDDRDYDRDDDHQGYDRDD